ncbi:MAG: hypothetical protein MK207_07765 [Saprospiraceae bacterium]|nr:hypothetical protein [Saprospiraceae bacterium]
MKIYLNIMLGLLFMPLVGFAQNGPFYFSHNNIQREYYLHIPNNLPVNSPIVYVLHGWGSSGSDIMSTTAFNILSDQNNFAVCYPTALTGSSGMTEWDVSGFSDIDFIKALNDSLWGEHQLDLDRVFATGFSYGAEMCYHIANCQTTDIFAAIAPLGGAMWDFITNGWPIICTPSINISVFILNGTNDIEFNYNGGYYQGVGNYYPVDTTVSFWTNHNACIYNTNYNMPDINNDNFVTEVTKYNNINTGYKVWLYKVNNGIHEWFDVAPWGNDDFWASEEIWNFFSQVGNNTINSSYELISPNKKLIKIVDLLGRETHLNPNTPLIYIYDDGTVEKKMYLE